MSDERTLRQRLVAEIGEQGQARIAQASACASTDIEARYLAFAGFRSVERGRSAGDTRSVHDLVTIAFAGSDGAVSELAWSAARALVQIKKAAGLPDR